MSVGNNPFSRCDLLHAARYLVPECGRSPLTGLPLAGIELPRRQLAPMRILLSLALALVCVTTARATPVMTKFSPRDCGFKFENTFVNDFIPALAWRTHGLCGGMTYAALDYYNAKQRAPFQYWRPANGTPLQSYLYNRDVDQIQNNLDKWAEVGTNPFGWRNSEFFKWGLEGKPGSRIAELKSFIDRGVPVPLGLQGAEHKSDNHCVLAIGYDMGKYKGDMGAHQEDFRIFILDPNWPTRTLRLAPDLGAQIWVERDENDVMWDSSKGWQTYFVDKNYHAKLPPWNGNQDYQANGMVHKLILAFQTGDDDLRGGDDTVCLTVNVTNSAGVSWTQVYPNISLGARWISNYQETVCVDLKSEIKASDIKSLVIFTTFSNKFGGDKWNMSSLHVSGIGGGGWSVPVAPPHWSIGLADTGPHYFTGDDKQITIPVKLRSFTPPIWAQTQYPASDRW